MWGDFDCDGILAALDALKAMLGILLLPYPGAGQGCPLSGEPVFPGSDLIWGDSDCDGTPEVEDVVPIFASLAGTPIEPEGDCPSIGDPVAGVPG